MNIFRNNETRDFENIVGKVENAGDQHFSPFPTMFSTLPKPIFNTSFTFILSSANAFNLDHSKILSFDKELNVIHNITFVFHRVENIVGKGKKRWQ